MRFKFNPVDLVQLAMIIATIAMLLIIAYPLRAQECSQYGPQTPECRQDINVATDVANVIGGGDLLSLGLGSPSFGAAIGDCMGTVSASYGWGIYGSQKLKESFWCEAFNLIRAGYTEAGIWILCNKTILKDMENCDKMSRVTIDEETTKDNSKTTQTQEIRQQFQMQDTRYSELVVRLDEAEATVAEIKQKPAQIIYRIPPEFLKQIDAAEDRRARAQAALQGEN